MTLRYTSQAIVAILATSGAFCLAQGRPDIAWMAGGHSEQVDAVAYSPDGLFVASCSGQSMDATTKLWRTSDGALVRTLTVPGLLPRSLAFSPDGSKLAAAGAGVAMWRMADGAPAWTVAEPETTCVAFSPDGASLATGSQDYSVKIWRASDGLLVRTLSRHTGRVSAVAFTPDGSTVTSAGFDRTIRAWSTADGEYLGAMTGHTDAVTCIAVSPDGATLASGSLDGTARLWRLADRMPIRTLTGHTGSVWSVAFAPDGSTLASGSSDASVKLWRTLDGTLLRAISYPVDSYILAVGFAPDGATLAAGGYRRSLRIWSVADGALVRELILNRSPMLSVAYSPDGGTLATGAGTGTNEAAIRDCTVRLWRASDGALLHALEGHTSPVEQVAFTPDGMTVGSAGGDDGTVKLWRVSDGLVLGSLAHPVSAHTVAFSPDGTTMATGGGDKSVKLWRVADGAPLNTLTGHTGSVEWVEFSPDGSLVASASSDRTVKLWRISDGMCLRTLTGHTNYVWTARFSPDGATLLSSSMDRTMRLWRVSDGAHLRTLTWQGIAYHKGGFTPNGAFVVAGGTLGGVALWRVSDGAQLLVYDQETGRGVNGVDVSPDGLHLAYVRPDATLVVARMPAEDYRPTTGAWVPDRVSAAAQTVILKAYLWRNTDRQFLAGKPMALTIDGTLVGTPTTNGAGEAALAWTVTDGPATRTIGAAFAGDAEYRACATTGTLTVNRTQTGIYLIDRSGSATDVVALRGWLRRSDTSAFLAGKLLTFSVDGTAVAPGVTDAGGQAAVNWRIAGWVTPGAHALTCAFAGDAALAPSSAAATLTATQTATKMYMPDRAGRPYQVGNRAYLTAYLYRMDNSPVGNKTLRFQVDGTTVGSGVTNDPEVGGNGRAMYLWDIPVTFAAGAHAMRADFAGDNGYTASHTLASLTLDMGALYIWPYVRSVVQGEAWPLRALVRTVPDYTWQPGLTIEFTLDPGPSQVSLGTAVTDAAGVATLQASSAGIAVGQHTIRASYAGSPAVAPAQADTTATVVAP